MSDVTQCPTCSATCRISGHDSEGLPKLKALQDTDAQQKIVQLRKSLQQIQEKLQTERSTAQAKISSLEAELAALNKPLDP